ncbi:MAG: hypothetical protein OHK0029_01490 [Armatimonadaceae bacterium]
MADTAAETTANTTGRTKSDSDRDDSDFRFPGFLPPRSEHPDGFSLALPSDLATKDLNRYPLFYGPISRLVWGFVMHRMTRAGRWLFFMSLALLLVGTISLEIQAYVPLVYVMALWTVAIALGVFSKPRARLSAHHADRIRAGEALSVEVRVTQTGRFTGHDYNIVPIRLPPEVDVVERNGVALGSLESGETRSVRVHLRCKKRGRFTLRGYRLETDFPLGLLNAYTNFKESRGLLVYPDYTPLNQLELPTGRRFHPGGIALVSKIGESYEYLGNREFREGDNIRDIDWRATARLGGEPIVREYREEFFQRIGVVLDTYVPGNLRRAERTQRRADFEEAVSVAAAVGDYIAAQEYIVDLFAAGPNLYHLTAGRSLAYLEQILDILACVEESREEPLETIAPEIQQYIERLTTVVCVFLQWDDTRQTFVENLRAGGAGVKVLLVSSDPVAAPADVTVLNSATWRSEVLSL